MSHFYSGTTDVIARDDRMADAFYPYMRRHDSRYSHVEGTDIIRYNDTIDVSLTRTGWNNELVITILDSGGNALNSYNSYRVGSTYYGNTGPYAYQAFVGDELSFFHFAGTEYYVAVWFGFITHNNKTYIIIGPDLPGSRFNNLNFNDLLFRCIEDNDAGFKLNPILNANLTTPNLLVLDDSIMYSTSGSIELINGIKSTSNLSLASTVTIDGKNNYVLGTNFITEITT